jgi:hypothetical protein
LSEETQIYSIATKLVILEFDFLQIGERIESKVLLKQVAESSLECKAQINKILKQTEKVKKNIERR